MHVYDELIPFLWGMCISSLSSLYNIVSSPIPQLHSPKHNVFRFLPKVSFACFIEITHYWDVFPSINFDRLYWRTKRVFDGKEKAKLQMILDYFCIMYQRCKKIQNFFVDEEIQLYSQAQIHLEGLVTRPKCFVAF